MSRKTNISKKPVVRSYGIQSYRAGDKKDYSEIIGTPTFFAANAAFVVRESEFARPYKAEDYCEMEYAAPLWPGFDWPGVDFPGMDLPVPDFPEMYDPWAMQFYCSVDPCWCEGETKTFLAGCTYEIVDAYFSGSESHLSVSFTKNSISITAADGINSGDSGFLTIVMKAYVPKGGTKWQGKYNPVIGTHSGKLVSKCTGDECETCDDSGIAWAGPETINQGESDKVLTITDSLGLGGPYSWSVSGSGFTLDSPTTTGLTNLLNADGAACGTATVTVIGCGETSITGHIRCSEGSWSQQDWSCPIPGAWTAHPSTYVFERVEGQYKVAQTITAAQGFDNITCLTDADPCSQHGDVEGCITWSCTDFFANWTNWIWYYCRTYPTGCAGYCMKNASKTLYKWVC